VFGKARDEAGWCALGSVKSQIGHTKAAAGAASLIKAVLSLRHRVLPSTLKVDTPNPKMELESSPFYLSAQTRPWLTRGDEPRRVAVSSFGFGGSNFHAVLEEYPDRAVEPAWDGSVEIVALSAPDRKQLANAVATWRQLVADGLDDVHFAARAAAARQSFSPAHDCRLVFVVEQGDDFARLLDGARIELGRNSATSWHFPNVHFGSGAPAGGVALLFPGQASQYVGMSRDLACVFSEVQAALATADAAAGAELALTDRIFPRPSFDKARALADEAALTATEVAQPALGAVCLAYLRVLERFGVCADYAAGHSFGELVALHAAGRIDEKTLLRLAVARGRAMADFGGDNGAMAAVRAPLDELAALIVDRGFDVVLANRNAPDQGVISGSKSAIQAAMDACVAVGWRVTPLAVSGAFHSPMMAPARDSLAAALKKSRISAAKIPVFANTSAAPYPDHADAARDMLAAQLAQPVRFVEMIEAMHAAGARTFVEVGPKFVLTSLVGMVLRGKPHEAFALDAGAGKRSGLVDMADALARLAAAGCAVSLKHWEKPIDPPRPARMAVPLVGANYRAPRKEPAPPPRAPARPAASVAPVAPSVTQERYAVNDVARNHAPAAPPPSNAAPAAADGTVVAGMFQIVQEGLRAMQVLQQQTAAAHQRFLEGQELTQRIFHQVMESQHRLFERMAGLPMTAATPMALPAMQPLPAAAPMVPQPVYAPPPLTLAPQPVFKPAVQALAAATQPAIAPPPAPVAAPAPVAPAAAAPSLGLEDVVLEVVSELTGYPREMVEPDMDMEADLGIDSIKRVEILAAVQARIPQVAAVESSHVGGLRTLRDIVQALGGLQPKEVAPTAPNPSVGPSPAAPAPVSDAVTDRGTPLPRRVLQVVDLPVAARRPIGIAPGCEVWIVEDGTGLAGALVPRFVEQGIAARIVGATRPIEGEACAEVGGLIHLFPPASATSADTAEQLKGAFALTRELAGDLRRAGREGGAMLITVSRLDGAFGLNGSNFDPLQGALAGLVKTADNEWPEVRCRAFDVDPQWTDTRSLAERLLVEISAEGPVEVGLSRGRRCGLTLVEGSPVAGPMPLAKGDVVVVSGGARGVTADAAFALAQKAQPTLVLLGRSPEPAAEPIWARGVETEAALKKAILQHVFGRGVKPTPSELAAAYHRHVAAREIIANLARMRAAGSKVVYRQIDVTDSAAVAALLAELRRTHGPIRGLVHGAGVIEDRRIEDKDDAAFARVFDTKVAGAAALLAAANTDDLRVLAFFSSVSGRFGRQGQVDYAMANEALNKLAQFESRRRPKCHVVALNWGPWEGGMVSPALAREFERLGITLIPRDAGASAFVAELCAPRGSVEIVLGGVFPQAAQPSDETSTESDVPLDDLEFVPAFRRTVDVATHPVLASHILANRPVVPLALLMEWLGHAALHEHPGLVLAGLDDVRVLRGISLDHGSVQVEAVAAPMQRRDGYGEVAVELHIRGADGRKHPAARARAILTVERPAAGEFPMPAGVDAEPFPFDIAGIYRDVLFHGPALHALKHVAGYSDRGLVAEVASAPSPSAWMRDPLRTAWLADPMVLDGAFQTGLLWSHVVMGAPSLPMSVGRYRQYVNVFPRDGVKCLLFVHESASARIVGDILAVGAHDMLCGSLERCTWTVDAALASAFAAGRAAAARGTG
jgi:malonyl CoA-acyl carrier protein transacylase